MPDRRSSAAAWGARGRRAVSRARQEAAIRGYRSRKVAVVLGNCQASPVAGLLAASRSFSRSFEIVPVPAVHRIEANQMPWLRRLLRRTALLIAQPIKTGYRDAGLGLDELSGELPTEARIVRWAPLYWD